MAYLFWAFVAAWLGLFIYMYRLVRRSRVLEERIAELLDRSRSRAMSGSEAAAAPIGASGSTSASRRTGAGTGG